MYKMVPNPIENKVYSRNLASFPVHAAVFSLAVFYSFVKFIFNGLILHFPKNEAFFLCICTPVSLCVYINVQIDRYGCICHIGRYECARLCICVYLHFHTPAQPQSLIKCSMIY